MLPCQDLKTPVSIDEIFKEGWLLSHCGCRFWKSTLLISSSPGVKPRHLGCSAFFLVFSEVGRGCQIYTGVRLHCFSSFPSLNGRRMPVLSEGRLAPCCRGRFALLCQDPAGKGASFCGGWAHGPALRGSSWHVAALPLSAVALGMWKQGRGERGLPVCLPSSRGQMLWSRGDWLQVQVVPQAASSSTEMPRGSPACLC